MPLNPDVSLSVPPGTRCAVCDYDLSGLTADALCPECGSPIRSSPALSADRVLLLSSVPPVQVQSLRAGLTLICVGTLGWMLLWRAARRC